MTKPRQESIAKQNLEAQGFISYLPLSPKYNRSNKIDGQCPMFPGYCFVGFEEQQSVFSLRSTVGVLSPVRFGGIVTILQQKLIDTLQQAEQYIKDSASEVNIVVGDKIQIHSGPLKGLEALASKVATDRVEVLLQLLGKEQRLSVETNHIKKL